MSTGYNGWTNYETWNVKLWMDNSEGDQEHYAEMAQEVWNDTDVSEDDERLHNATYTLSQRIKDEFEEANPLGSDSSMWSDMLSAALSEVNWYEIAKSIIEDHGVKDGE